MKEIISVRISNYLSHGLAEQIAAARWNRAEAPWVNAVRQSLFDGTTDDCFDVIATDSGGKFVGRLHCIRNEKDRGLWYYGDLFVVPDYRRKGVATQLVGTAKAHLSELGAHSVRCYVEPQNEPSLRLQRSLGFAEKPYEPFDLLQNEGQIMFVCEIPSLLSVIPATADEAYFVCILYAQNRDALHTERISLQEWKGYLSQNDPDEAHFLICKGAIPVGYIKLNGLQGHDAWLSTLFVSRSHHRTGVGTFGVRFAESFAKKRGFGRLFVQTTCDNVSAQALYRSCGFEERRRDECRVCFGKEFCDAQIYRSDEWEYVGGVPTVK